ncbi:hypothetical protein DL766_008411 [Monosporascus sp. MC13-8B]|uniref:Spindle pole body-associated protein cut12 domain-containing protein n=1 Tax=Monosporascus cannonballus TaxID=155416 RepID=A0ABY0H0K6_9PEZI|nr:hypothetical protein DL762_008051 [Monosporascus cannonballus]RYP19588.1 hypothetical protein DL766_008411 [Monosporascus sp. MC13-8B]
MLGWALKKSFQGATGTRDAPVATGGDDTTQIDVPDTPAPIFAARAIKNAIFGQSAAAQDATALPEQQQGRTTARNNMSTAALDDAKSPSKPTSILLTPGTGTARRKRVSFGRDVKAGNSAEPGSVAMNADGTRKKTTLQQALENSRSSRAKLAAQNATQSGESATAPGRNDGEDSEGEWEDDVCNHDVTVDLNEPHSNSGKYWKSEFARYHEEARAEMDKLVKYKHMAKSYAKKKDAEAIDLAQKLKEEQEKVLKMEQKVTEMAAQIANARKHDTDQEHATLVKNLSMQTALAVQQRDQVNELEAILKGQQNDASPGRSRRRRDASPRTEQTLLEVTRDLRRARSELKQMENLREENERLKSDLNAALQEAKMLRDEIKKESGSTSGSLRTQRLDKQLREARDELRETRNELRQKDSETRKLSRDYESLKRDAKARTAEAMQVLQEKNDRIAQLDDKIARLEKDIVTLKAKNASSIRHRGIDTALAEHNKIVRDLRSDIESLSRPSKYEAARRGRTRQRSGSVEDLTLDMTQRSLFEDKNEEKRAPASKQTQLSALPYTDLTTSMKEIEEQLKQKTDRMETGKRDWKHSTETLDLCPLAASMASKAPLPSSLGSRRAMSDRVNGSIPTDYGAPTKQPGASNYHPNIGSRRVASTRLTTSPAKDDKYSMHGAGSLDRPMRERRAASISNRAAPSTAAAAADDNVAQDIDLFQLDRFARLGGPETTNRATTGATANASRCTLPADRQAAARARLEQKRLERQKEKEGMRGGAGSRRALLDKENVIP